MMEEREGSEEESIAASRGSIRTRPGQLQLEASGRARRYPELLTSCRTPNDRATPRIAAIHSWASVLALGRSRESGSSSSGANAKPAAVVRQSQAHVKAWACVDTRRQHMQSSLLFKYTHRAGSTLSKRHRREQAGCTTPRQQPCSCSQQQLHSLTRALRT